MSAQCRPGHRVADHHRVDDRDLGPVGRGQGQPVGIEQGPRQWGIGNLSRGQRAAWDHPLQQVGAIIRQVDAVQDQRIGRPRLQLDADRAAGQQHFVDAELGPPGRHQLLDRLRQRRRPAPRRADAILVMVIRPPALSGGGPGSEIQTPMAIVILFGLLSSTVLNMIVVPALCLRFGAVGRRLGGAGGREASVAPAGES